MKVRVNQDICIGCGLCASMSPEVFQMNDDGLAEAITEDVADDQEEAAEESANDCPVSAIFID
jgi:ferredoxin